MNEFRGVLSCSDQFNAVLVDGDLYVWSADDGISENEDVERFKVETSQKIRAVSCGEWHFAAIGVDNTLYTWGCGKGGVLGYPVKEDEFVDFPVPLKTLGNEKIIDCCAKGQMTGAVSESGALYTWGTSDFGRLGHGSLEPEFAPKRVEGLEKQHVVSVSCELYRCAVLTASGEVYVFGRTMDDDCLFQTMLDPVRVPLPPCQSISVGIGYSVAVTDSGVVMCWGEGNWGQLGVGDLKNHAQPFEVRGLRVRHIAAAVAGLGHTVAVADNGEIWQWGTLDRSGMGKRLLNQYQTPYRVRVDDAQVLALASCRTHTLVLLSSGAVVGWGSCIGTERRILDAPEVIHTFVLPGKDDAMLSSDEHKGDDDGHICIEMGDPYEKAEGDLRYTLYPIRIHAQMVMYPDVPYTIHRRFREFRALYSLLERISTDALPKHPSKHFFGRFKADRIEARKRAFQEILETIVATPRLRFYVEVLAFLKPRAGEEPIVESRV